LERSGDGLQRITYPAQVHIPPLMVHPSLEEVLKLILWKTQSSTSADGPAIHLLGDVVIQPLPVEPPRLFLPSSLLGDEGCPEAVAIPKGDLQRHPDPARVLRPGYGELRLSRSRQYLYTRIYEIRW